MLEALDQSLLIPEPVLPHIKGVVSLKSLQPAAGEGAQYLVGQGKPVE